MHKCWLGGFDNSFTKNPIANKLSPQSLHHSGLQGEVFLKQEEPPQRYGTATVIVSFSCKPPLIAFSAVTT